MPRRLTAAQFVAIDRRVSPDDVKFKMLERDRLAATDARTPAQVWLGEPPPWRSALAQSKHQSPTGARAPVDQAHPTKKTRNHAGAGGNTIQARGSWPTDNRPKETNRQRVGRRRNEPPQDCRSAAPQSIDGQEHPLGALLLRTPGAILIFRTHSHSPDTRARFPTGAFPPWPELADHCAATAPVVRECSHHPDHWRRAKLDNAARGGRIRGDTEMHAPRPAATLVLSSPVHRRGASSLPSPTSRSSTLTARRPCHLNKVFSAARNAFTGSTPGVARKVTT